jgi:hypothetical protein
LVDKGDVERFDEQQNILDYTIRNESLDADLLGAMKQLGMRLGEEEYTTLKTTFRTNQSARKRDYGFYYDQASIDLVAEREAFMIDKYAYQPPILGA